MSAEAKHTPGPWRYSKKSRDSNFETGQRYLIQSLSPPMRLATTHGAPESEADAALIAAAPDLYAALLDMMAASDGTPKSCGCVQACVHTYGAARAAIAKAEGRTA